MKNAITAARHATRTALGLAALPVALALSMPLDANAQDAEDGDQVRFVGDWTGTLDLGAMQMRLRFVLSAEDGALSGMLYSVDQGNAEIPISTLEASGDTISMSIPHIGGAYTGTMGADGATISGTFSQGGLNRPLVLAPSEEEATEPSRPQEPTEPYPYMAEEVSFLNTEGGHALGGTLTRPFGDAPFPAVVLISGSGPQDRDEALAGHRPFLVLADHLARDGIAALRYDDRGVGASGGDFSQATTEDFATDALAAVAYLKSRDDIDPGAIGLAGHSEGGLVAPIAAVRSSDVAFLVLMAAPGVDGARILVAQGELIARAGGATEEAIAANRERQEEVFALLREEPDPAVAGRAVEAVVRRALAEASDEELQLAGVTDSASAEAVVAGQVKQVNNRWFSLLPDPRPGRRAGAGDGSGARDDRREGPAGPARREPARDRGGAGAGWQSQLRGARAARPKPPLPARGDRCAERVQLNRGDVVGRCDAAPLRLDSADGGRPRMSIAAGIP